MVVLSFQLSKLILLVLSCNESLNDSKNQETIQSSNTADPGNHIGK